MKIRIGVAGPTGNVGSALVRRGAVPLLYRITDDQEKVSQDIKKVLEDERPDIIVNTVSKTSVDWCEHPDNNAEVIRVNVRGLWKLAVDAEELKIPVIALSTDHVFDGKHGPYREDYKRKLPVNFYGLSKWGMEEAAMVFDNVKIVRTSNLFWRDDRRITWYLDEAYKGAKVYVPFFQKRSFMHVEHFVDALLAYIERYDQMPKVLNLSGSETIDYHKFVVEFAKAVGFPFPYKFVRKIFETEKYIAKRPKKVGLNTSLSAKLGIPQFSYSDGLELLK